MLTRDSHSKRPCARRLPVQALAANFFCLVALTGCASPKRFEFTRIQMGVQCRIVVYGADRASTEKAAAAAFEEIARLDGIMSDYRPESEVSRLSQARVGEMVPIDADLAHVLATARRISHASDGAFDVTAGPYVALWRRARKEGRLPQPDELEAAKRLVGWRHYSTSSSGEQAHFFAEISGVKIDLGGIAKGYAAQHAVEVLSALEHPRCMVAMAGDIVVGDAPPSKSGWAITTPNGERLVLANCGVSTSGDDRQFIEINGMRYSHIIDPRTGLGAIAPRPSCTVIAQRGEWADALSTAGYLVGREAWEKLEREFPGTRVMWGPVELTR
jgi:thiamine biosynthesis lipoprotein